MSSVFAWKARKSDLRSAKIRPFRGGFSVTGSKLVEINVHLYSFYLGNCPSEVYIQFKVVVQYC